MRHKTVACLIAAQFCLNPDIHAQKTLGKMVYVAHLGASYLAPKNTMASIQLAWDLGAQAAECDVMLFHDKKTGSVNTRPENNFLTTLRPLWSGSNNLLLQL